MPIYPQLQGNVFKEPDEDDQIEEKKSDQEMKWKRQIEEEKRAKSMKDRIQKAAGKTLPIEREAGEDHGKGQETLGGANTETQKTPPEASREEENVIPGELGSAANAMEIEHVPKDMDFARALAASTKNANIGARSPSDVATAIAPRAMIKQASTALLKGSWLNVISSFGLTLFYIAFHFIGAYVAHMSWFCKFGEEWIPAQASNIMDGNRAGAKAKKGLEYAEILTFFISIALYLMLILIILFILLGPILAACKLLNTITFGLIC